jgi:serine protease AprX
MEPFDDPSFDSDQLDRTVIAIPLLREMERLPRDAKIGVIIDLNLRFEGGRVRAAERIDEMVARIASGTGEADQVRALTPQYVVARLTADEIREIVRLDARAEAGQRAVFRIWPDFEVRALLTQSRCTVKADAAGRSFSALGDGVTWAVMDSGIEGGHTHFRKYLNLNVGPPIHHRDFTVAGASPGPAPPAAHERPLVDLFGHGTHVAGIIAGEQVSSPGSPISAATRHRDENNRKSYQAVPLDCITGVAPMCKLVSLKVLDDNGRGAVSNLIAGISYIQEVNGYGRNLAIHGVNMSVGYDFDPEWFACGQSPLCVEVDRLVRSGVVVVVAAGNTGYGLVQTASARGVVAAGMDLTINDPGNAELAITVGSTHREMPHVYGVSYFSSKGPTGDGRLKPDLVAPGEKIISCAAGKRRDPFAHLGPECVYYEESGTSMAAPHVSGVVAALLSVRREFVGRPERVKEIFLSTATDLKRERYFQGHGLVDLMRAIQSV